MFFDRFVNFICDALENIAGSDFKFDRTKNISAIESIERLITYHYDKVNKPNAMITLDRTDFNHAGTEDISDNDFYVSTNTATVKVFLFPEKGYTFSKLFLDSLIAKMKEEICLYVSIENITYDYSSKDNLFTIEIGFQYAIKFI